MRIVIKHVFKGEIHRGVGTYYEILKYVKYNCHYYNYYYILICVIYYRLNVSNKKIYIFKMLNNFKRDFNSLLLKYNVY